MGNEQKLENLKQLIRSSIMLSVQEKEEWLSLVELMNDKQMSELMELLGQKATAPTPQIGKTSTVAPSPTTLGEGATGTTPGLSHISNLPNTMMPDGGMMSGRMNDKIITEAKIPPSPTSLAFQSKVAERILPKANIVNASTSSKPVMPETGIQKSAVIASQETPVTSDSVIATTQPTTVKTPESTLVMQLPQEAASIAVAMLRQHGIQSLIQAFRNLTINYGYFTVMENFEHSPLYAAYIKAGEQFLAGKKSTEAQALSNQEFEMIADLTQSLKINRL